MVAIRGGKRFENEMAKLAARIAKPATLNVGFLSNATYPNGTPVALVAAVQNFGAPSRGIPPRPFMGAAVAKYSRDWPKGIAALLKGGANVDAALNITGSVIKGQIQMSIRDTNDPPLSPITVARKGFSKPLIDTGHLINSVDFEVK